MRVLGETQTTWLVGGDQDGSRVMSDPSSKKRQFGNNVKRTDGTCSSSFDSKKALWVLHRELTPHPWGGGLGFDTWGWKLKKTGGDKQWRRGQPHILSSHLLGWGKGRVVGESTGTPG